MEGYSEGPSGNSCLVKQMSLVSFQSLLDLRTLCELIPPGSALVSEDHRNISSKNLTFIKKCPFPAVSIIALGQLQSGTGKIIPVNPEIPGTVLI